MATDQDLIDALRKAARAFKGSPLTLDERQQIIEEFNKATGTQKQKARKAVAKTASVDESLVERTYASDDADRSVRDLDNILDDWTPGS